METYKTNSGDFFQRLMRYASNQGVRNANELAKKLGYSSPDKLYRLKRGRGAKPSYDILQDIADLFQSIDLRWLLTGEASENTVYTTLGNININTGSDVHHLSKDNPGGFFNRLMEYAGKEGVINTNDLSLKLGYSSPQKLYRLKGLKNAKPSYDIIKDVANLFQSIDIRWLITGKKTQITAHTSSFNQGSSAINYDQTAYNHRNSRPFSHPNEEKNVYPTGVIGQLLEEKDRVIAAQKEVITTQQKTIALLEENCFKKPNV